MIVVSPVGAVLLSLVAAQAQNPRERRTAVAVDFTALDEDHFESLGGVDLESRVVLRLIQDGFVVVSRAAQPQVIVSVVAASEGLLLRTNEPPLARMVAIRPPVDAKQALAFVVSVTELAREARARIAAVAAPVNQPPPAEAPLTSIQPWPERHGLALGLGLDLGLLLRGEAVDPLTQLFGRLEAGILCFEAQTGLAFSRSDLLRSEDIHFRAGLGFILEPRSRFRVVSTGLAGIWVHHFDYAMPGAIEAEGTRTGALGAIAARLEWEAAPGLALSCTAAISLASRGIGHTFNGERVWVRRALRGELAMGIVWRP